MRARLLAAGLVLALSACSNTYDYGYAVALKIDADPSLSDAVLAQIRVLQLQVSGAESDVQQLATAGAPFSSGREERVLYRPQVGSGTLAMTVTAFDGQGGAVGFGQTMVTLSPNATVSATIVVSTSMVPPSPDLGAPPAPVVMPSAPTVPRLGSVMLTADVPVTWSVKESNGGTIGSDGTYTAPGEPGVYTVIATRTDFPVSTSVPVTVGFNAIDLLAGGVGGPGTLDGQGSAARLGMTVSQLAVDSFGNLYFADRPSGTVRKIDGSGNVTTLAGTPGMNGDVDGNGAAARFNDPYGVALDASFGNLYVSECGSHVIRRVSLAPPFAVTTISGTAGMAGAPNGMAGAAARFNCPAGMVFDNTAPGGPSLYVADFNNQVIQQVRVADGQTTLVAGMSGTAGSTDTNPTAMPPTVGEFNHPVGVALVTSGSKRLYVSDQNNQSVRQVALSSGNTVSTVAKLGVPLAQIVADQTNSLLYLAGNTSDTVWSVTFSGTATLLAGASGQAGYVDADGGAARFNYVEGIALTGGNLYVTDGNNAVIRKIGVAAPNMVSTFVGAVRQSGVQNSNGSDGSTARFNRPISIDTDGAGNVYVADYANHTVRKVAVAAKAGGGYSAAVTTPAGQAGAPSGANVATPTAGASANFNHPFCVRFVAPSTLLVCDHDNNAIRAVDLSAVSFTVSPYATGLPAAPRGLAPMPNGDLYFTAEGQRVYLWDHVERKARAVWGSPAGVPGSGDGGGAAASFHDPTGIVFDGDHALYVADRTNDLLRRIDLESGQVTTVAGAAGKPGTADGALGTSLLWFPWQLAFHDGFVYIADGGSYTIRRYDPGSGTVTTVLGTATQGGFRAGPVPGFLSDPAQVIFLPTGEMVVSSDNAEDNLVVVH